MPRDPLDQVYGLISAYRYQDAIHFLNKLLKKQPNHLIAKVWKCEALYGLGNLIESEELMASILQQKPTEKRTMESIAEFFRSRGNYTKLIEVYEDLLKDEPNDENLRKALFDMCGLAGDYKKQQQNALFLYKQSSNFLFYCMAVVCLLQQGDQNPVALELAERMMNKHLDSGKLKSKNEILLLVTVLEKRKKFSEALDWILKFETELKSIVSVFDKKIEFLTQLGRYEECVVLLRKHIERNPDSWSHYENYLNVVTALQEAGGVADDPNIDDSFEKGSVFLKQMKIDNPKLRGPCLAFIKLLTLQENIIAPEKIHVAIAEYFEKFGDKSICVFDLKNYIVNMPANSAIEVFEKAVEPFSLPPDMLHLQASIGPHKHISLTQIQTLLGKFERISVKSLEVHCADLIKCYKSAAECDRRDQYLVLFAQSCFSLFHKTGDSKHVIDAITNLEDATALGPSIFAVQVLLLQLYFAIGATKSARKIYDQLRIQSVQVDTLSHLLLADLSSTGHFSLAMEMWETALRILQQCTTDSIEALFWCYRSSFYHRVEEFTRCTRRFERSMTVALIRLEKIHLDVVIADPVRTEQLLIRVQSLVDLNTCLDNRDFKALPSWDFSTHSSPDNSFQELLLFCRLREATLFCINQAICYGKEREEGNQKQYNASLDKLQTLYTEAISSVQKRNTCVAATTRLHLIVQRPLPSLIHKILETDGASTEKVCATLKQSTGDSVASLIDLRSKNPRLCLEVAVTQIEFLSLLTVVCGSARIGQQVLTRRRSEQIVRTLETCWTHLEGNISQVSPPKETPMTLEGKLKDNYASAVDDMKKVIRKKLAYLHKL